MISLILLFADPIIEYDGNAVISANWIMLGLASIVGFFFIRTLNRMEKNMEALGKTVAELQTTSKVHDERISNVEDYKSGDNQKIAELIYAKLKAMQ